MVKPRSSARASSRRAQAFMARLRLDHARLSRVLREVEVQRLHLAHEPSGAKVVLTEALKYLVDYQHRQHHPLEDRLYARLAGVRGELDTELRGLELEHERGARRARELASSLGRLTPETARGRAGARFRRALEDYVDETRDHMRREETAVFQAGVEGWLTDADWRALAGDDGRPDDPLGDASRMRRDYPALAAALAEPVRDVVGAARRGSAAGGPHARALAALRDGADALVETYGELAHEGLDVMRENVAVLRAVPSPLAAAAALADVSRRSYRFAARCIAEPSRVAIECANQMLAPFAAPAASRGTPPRR